MEKKNLIISASSIALALLVGAGIMSASAHNSEEGMFKGWGPSKENHEEIDKAIEENNYEAFQDLTQDRKIGEAVTEENFEKFSEAHKLREEGKFEESKAIMDELGIRGPNGPKGNPEEREAIKEAITNNDYASWKNLTEGKRIQEKINEDSFSQFVKAHQLMEEGNFEEGRQIMEELGCAGGFGRGGGHRGMMR